MALDITLLRILKHRKDYEVLHRQVPDRVVDAATASLIKDFGQWLQENPTADTVDLEAFGLWLKLAHPKLSDDQLAIVQAQIRKAKPDVDQDIRAGIVERLVAASTATKLEDLVSSFVEGEDINFASQLRSIVDYYEDRVARRVKIPYVDVDIDELLDEEENDEGIKWRLGILNQHMRPLRPGDFLCIAMRPDAGKTSLLTSELTFMAPQCPPGRGVMWFNNEGPGRRIVGRLWQSALDATFDDISAMRKGGKHRQAYAAAVGGSDRIKVLDVHDMCSHDIEDIIRETEPYIVVLDMIDNIRFSGGMVNGGQRTDQLLEAMYQWARVIGVKHDCIVICTSQISSEGEGMTRPLMSMLKDSKTGKQGALDALIMGGKSNDPLLQGSRFISIPKNKLARSNMPGDPFGYEVIFDSKRGRYRMPEES